MNLKKYVIDDTISVNSVIDNYKNIFIDEYRKYAFDKIQKRCHQRHDHIISINSVINESMNL